MLPFLVPLWETDATLRAAVQQSVEASLTSPGTGAVLVGAQLDGDARLAAARALYTAAAHARYARAFDVTLGGGAGPPEDDLDADAELSASWTLSPLATLVLDAEGSLATTSGVRADTRLIALDPFLFGQRLEYAAGGDLSLSLGPSRRDGITVEGGYLQAGALAADAPEAVGVDTHEGHVAASFSRDLGPRDTIAPEVRYAYTHYYHALLDTDLRRGPADVHTVEATGAISRELGRAFSGTAKVGVSVGTPMPLLGSTGPVVAPDLGLSLRWTGRRARVTARYRYAYTSLGPRIGFGQQHDARVRVDVRPLEGARHRDLALRGTLRFAHGGAPLAADPDLAIPGVAPARPAAGTLTTTTLAAGARLDAPLRRGLAFTSGVDLTFVQGVVDPAPPGGVGRPEVMALFTFGLAATISTDKRRTVARDPDAEQEEAARRGPAPAGPDERRDDRTRTYDERTMEDAVDQGWERDP